MGDRSMLHKLNLKKECEFAVDLFRSGKPELCAESSMVTFAGLWFNTSTPVDEELAFIGRMVTNYQNMEAIFHSWIMCVPYIVIFDWMFQGFHYSPRSPLMATVESM